MIIICIIKHLKILRFLVADRLWRQRLIPYFFRPFSRAVTLQKDSAGHVGFIYKDGKISSLVKDSSAARNGLLIDHQLCEVNGQCVIGMKVKKIYCFHYLFLNRDANPNIKLPDHQFKGILRNSFKVLKCKKNETELVKQKIGCVVNKMLIHCL